MTTRNKIKKILKPIVESIIRERKSLKEDYSGYVNKDTYNAALYITNEGEVYKKYSSKIGNITPDDAKQYFQLLRRYNKYGFDDVNQKNVNWQEVADDMNS